MHERADKIETIGRKDSNKYLLECSIVLNQAEREIHDQLPILAAWAQSTNSLWKILPTLDVMRNCKVNRVSSTPYRNDVAKSKQQHRNHICPFRALGSISKRTNQNHKKNADVEIQEDFENSLARTTAQKLEWIRFDIGGGGRNQLQASK